MAGGVDVGTRFVDFGMDGEGGGVDGLGADYYVSFLVDEDEVRDFDLRKVPG